MNRQTAARVLATVFAFTAACSPVSAGPEAEPTLSEPPPALSMAAFFACKSVVEEYQLPDPALVNCVNSLNESIQSLDNRWPSDKMFGDASVGWLTTRHIMEGWEELGLVDSRDAIGGKVAKSILNSLEYERTHNIDPSLVY